MNRGRKQTSAWLVALIAGCTGVQAPTFPASDVEAFDPPPYYADWWSQVVQCAGRRAALRDVMWFHSARRPLLVDGNLVGGYWWSRGNRIAVAQIDDARAVRHEMLHAVLQSGAHAPEYFGTRCGAFVLFQASEQLPASAASARRTSADSVLTVDFTVLTTDASVHRTAGRMTVLVRAQNQSGAAAWVRLPGSVYASAFVGTEGYGAVLAPVSEQFFDVGQTRTMAVDLVVSHPGSYRIRVQYGNAQSEPREWAVRE